MKYLKTFELYTGNGIDYDVNDIVVCIDSQLSQKNFLKEGNKYRVIKIYQIPEDKFLRNPFLRVDVEDVETGELSKGWRSNIFKTIIEFDADKYNL